MQYQATRTARVNAQTLRRKMTDAERRLWLHLRDQQLGVRFRRQHPLGPYIADFACLSPKLIIELDGLQHAQRQAYDRKRDDFFKEQGFGVLRFATDAPFNDLAGVLQAIANWLDSERPLAPIPAFPQRGKESEI